MIRRRSVAGLAAAALAAGSLAAAGCGGDDSASDAAEGTAGFVPASSPMYLDVTADLESEEWTRAESVLRAFPAYPEEGVHGLIAEGLAQEGADLEEDVLPLLGDRVAVAALEVPPAEDVAEAGAEGAAEQAAEAGFLAVVEIAEGAEEDVRSALDENGAAPAGEREGVEYRAAPDGDLFVAVTDGAAVISEREQDLFAALDARAGGGDATLAGTDRFDDAVSDLPEEAVARIWLDTGAFLGEAAGAVPQAEQFGGLEGLEESAMAAALRAEDDGLRVTGNASGASALGSTGEFSPGLLGNVPADATAYVGFSDLAGGVEDAYGSIREGLDEETRSQVDAFIPQIQAMIGVSLDDLAALTSGEHALVVGQAAGAPSVGLVLGVEDGERASATLEGLRTGIPQALGAMGAGGVPEWRSEELAGGVQGWSLPLGDGLSLTYAVDGETVVIASSPEGAGALLSPEQDLGSLDRFTAATGDMPENVTAVLWLDAERAVGAGEGAGLFEGAPPEVLANLRPVRDIAAWSAGGERQEFELFLRVEE